MNYDNIYEPTNYREKDDKPSNITWNITINNIPAYKEPTISVVEPNITNYNFSIKIVETNKGGEHGTNNSNNK